jgi:hypothetical protein
MARPDEEEREDREEFGGDPEQPNFIFTPPGWRHLVRLYGTREAIVDGSYQFPKPRPVA